MSPNGVNLGDLGMYSGGAFIPDGKYCLYFTVMQHQPTDKQTGAPKGKSNLGVMIDFYPLANPSEDAKLQKFYSMGQKADESFAPNPETGKGIVAIPGAKGGTLNDKTNWFLFLNSLYQSAMPQGVFTNDLSTIDGVWVYVVNQDEPAERAGFASATSEVNNAADRKPAKIAVVSEILEGGAPWEGGGQLPAAPVVEAPAAPVAVARPAARPVAAAPAGRPAAAAPRAVAPRPAARPAAAAAPAPVATNGNGNEELRTQALNGIGEILSKNVNGLNRVALRTDTFKYLSKAAGEDIAGQVITEYFEPSGQATLVNLLGELGYGLVGPQVKPL